MAIVTKSNVKQACSGRTVKDGFGYDGGELGEHKLCQEWGFSAFRLVILLWLTKEKH